MNDNILERYANGISLNKLARENNCAYGTIKRYLIRNGIELRDRSSACKFDKILHPQRHSEETKKKLSHIRTQYLKEHPDKVPYLLNHSSRESYPEKRFRTILTNIGLVGWIQHYRQSIYQYDFAFPSIKLDVEIDGETHNQESVIIKDMERDKFSSDNGWTVLRFSASDFNVDAAGCIDKLLNVISELNPTYDPNDVDAWNILKPTLNKSVLHTKICPKCTKEFHHRDKRTTYCSASCYRRVLSERMTIFNKVRNSVSK